MRYLILSDIHANFDALESVLEDADGGYDRVLCCGDLVGYGACPNEVTNWARKRLDVAVRGNHDKAAVGLDTMEWFNPFARASTQFTTGALTSVNREYLRELPQGPVEIDRLQVVHGSPQDEDEYLVNSEEVRYLRRPMLCPVTFFGHTHLQGGFLCHRNGVARLVRRRQARKQEIELEQDCDYLVNPGSVGQPRDGDPRAAYAIYSPEVRLVTFRRTSYDIKAAQKRIRDAGLPEILADRLAVGC